MIPDKLIKKTFICRNSGNKDTNYMLAILDSRMKIVAHERFQYVLLKKFGEQAELGRKNNISHSIHLIIAKKKLKKKLVRKQVREKTLL